MPTHGKPTEPSLSIEALRVYREFADMPPVNPRDRERPIQGGWRDMAGLSADVGYYGQWVWNEAFARVSHLYPKAKLPREQAGVEATAVAWLWARTVKCPACAANIPLVRSFWLARRRGSATWLEPRGDELSQCLWFEVVSGEPPSTQVPGISAGARTLERSGTRATASFRCLACGEGAAGRHYVDREMSEGRAGYAPLAMVVDGPSGWTFAGFYGEQSDAALGLADRWMSERRAKAPSGHHIARQLAALAAFADVVGRARPYIIHDMIDHYSTGSSSPYATVERDTASYADGVVEYLRLLVDTCAEGWSTSAGCEPLRRSAPGWHASRPSSKAQGFAEVNPFCEAPGSWASQLRAVTRAIHSLPS